MSAPGGKPVPIDTEIWLLVEEWKKQATEAVTVGIRMAQRLLELERERDDLRLQVLALKAAACAREMRQ